MSTMGVASELLSMAPVELFSATSAPSSWLNKRIFIVLGVLLIVQGVWWGYLRRVTDKARKALVEARTAGPRELEFENPHRGVERMIRVFDVIWDAAYGARDASDRMRTSSGAFTIPLQPTEDAHALHASVKDKLVNAFLLDGVAYYVDDTSIQPGSGSVVVTARLMGRKHVFGADVYAPEGSLPPRYVTTQKRQSVRAVLLAFNIRGSG